MVHPLRVIPGPWVEVGGVGPASVAPGSVGGPHLRVMVNVGVGVRGRCFPPVPLTPGVLSVSRGGLLGVWTSGGVPTHGVLVSRGVTQNSTNTYYLVLGTSWEASFPKANKTWVQKTG